AIEGVGLRRHAASPRPFGAWLNAFDIKGTRIRMRRSYRAQMAELVDALVSGTSAARCGGSSPLLGTKQAVGSSIDGSRKRAVLFCGAPLSRSKSVRLWTAQARVELLWPQRVIFLERLVDPRTRG